MIYNYVLVYHFRLCPKSLEYDWNDYIQTHEFDASFDIPKMVGDMTGIHESIDD